MKIKHIRLNSYQGINTGKQNQNNFQNIPPLGLFPSKKILLPQKSMLSTLNPCKVKLSENLAKPLAKDKKIYLQVHHKNNAKQIYKKLQCLSSRENLTKTINNECYLNSARQKTQKTIIDTKQQVNPKQQKNILKNHKITERMRVKMIDWMIEVLSAYKYSQQTFFLCISIMDNYFSKCKQILPVEQLHIIGLVSIYIASKFQQVKCLRLKSLFEEIGHKKISKSKIIVKQAQILNTVDFILIQQTPFNYLTQILNSQELSLSQQQFKEIFKHSIYILKASIYDHIFYYNKPLKTLAYSSILVSIQTLSSQYIKIHQTIYKNIPSDFINQVLETANQLYEKVSNFQSNYPNLTNLIKYNGQGISFKNGLQLISSISI